MTTPGKMSLEHSLKEEPHENPIESDGLLYSSYELKNLEEISSCLDNLCIMSHFCTLTNLDDYIVFMRNHLD
tara:strand:+ start:213 stop:428 length:216 start_codon:yes stop_codon:yes gene_type:complete